MAISFSTYITPLALASEEHQAIHWGYIGNDGPEHWGELSPSFQVCRVGMEQSPIDLQQAVTNNLETITFQYSESPLQIINNGHTIQVNYAPGSSILLDGQTFELIQFHFHHPSEHQVMGQRFPMELHLVHRNDAGTLAVVGVFLQLGQPNIALQPVWDVINIAQEPEGKVSGVRINAEQFLPANRGFVHYLGSLTTPPCSEGVNWIVMQQPIEISQSQIQQFAQVVSMNARPIQNLNHRFLLKS